MDQPLPPEWRKNKDGIDNPTFWKPGIFTVERLVNMSHHNYRLEPNVRFSPDSGLVFFISNMFGPSYVFAVEVAKAVPGAPMYTRRQRSYRIDASLFPDHQTAY